jgi:tRNA(fMet)-specific endonuclease VapC
MTAPPPALLDTSTLSDVMRGQDTSVQAAAAVYLAQHGQFTFSILSRYEILRGLCARGATQQVRRFEVQCQRSLLLPLSDEIIVRAAVLYGELYRRGQLIGDADILIAATALVHGLQLVTENRSHFQRIPGLVLTSWRNPQ